MAQYLVQTKDDPKALRVDAANIQEVVDKLKLKDGDEVEVFRIAAEPRTVKVKTETVRRVEIE